MQSTKYLASILTNIDEMLPNSISATIKCIYANDVLRNIAPISNTTQYTPSSTTTAGFYVLTSGIDYYALPTGINIDDIKEIIVNSTTGAISSTSIVKKYTYKGINDDLSGYNYYEWTTGSYFGIHPIPTSNDTNHVMRIRYLKPPVTFTTANYSSDTLGIDCDYEEALRKGIIAKIAKSGDFPDITMANNWESEHIESYRSLNLRAKQKNQRQRGNKISYKDWEW